MTRSNRRTLRLLRSNQTGMVDSQGRDTMLRRRGSLARLVLCDDHGGVSQCLKRRVKLGARQESGSERTETHRNQQGRDGGPNKPPADFNIYE